VYGLLTELWLGIKLWRAKDLLWSLLLFAAAVLLFLHFYLLGLGVGWPAIVAFGAFCLMPRSRRFWHLFLFVAGYAFITALDPSSGLPLSGWLLHLAHGDVTTLTFAALGALCFGYVGLHGFARRWHKRLLIPAFAGILCWNHAGIINAHRLFGSIGGSQAFGVLVILGVVVAGYCYFLKPLSRKG
jgi:hypothetical protein